MLLDDANFNVIGIMDDDHNLTERREYHPYGKRQIFINGGNDSSDYRCTAEIPYPQAVQPFGSSPKAYSICDEGHQGLMHDKETGQINVRTRYQDPVLCRYIGRDPMGYIDGSSLYAYLMDSPANGLDPTGTERVHTNGSDVWWIIQEPGTFYDSDKKWVWIGKLHGSKVEIQIGFAKGKHFLTPKSKYRVSMATLKAQADNWWDRAARLDDLPTNAQERYIAGAISSAYDGVRPQPTASLLDKIADAGGTGLRVGGKALANSAGKAVVSTLTVGQVEAGNILAVTKRDLRQGYAASEFTARIASEIAVGFATAGLSNVSKAGHLSKAGKVIQALDRVEAVVNTAQGTYKMVSTGGADGKMQLAAGIFGGVTQIAAARKAGAGSLDEMADGLTSGKNVGKPANEVADATANARKVPSAEVKRGTGGQGYRANDTGPHRDLSPGSNRAPGQTHTTADGRIQSHHPVQQEWAKQNVPGYNPNDAPTILLPTRKGDPHAIINGMQRRTANRVGNSLRQEMYRGYRQMIDAGVDIKAAQRAMKKNYKYFVDLLRASLD